MVFTKENIKEALEASKSTLSVLSLRVPMVQNDILFLEKLYKEFEDREKKK